MPDTNESQGDALPKFTPQTEMELRGIAMVQAAVADLGWLFREQAGKDYGIDAAVEIIDRERQVTGRQVALQIKCGSSYFRQEAPGGWVFHGERKHLNYWRNYSLPVVVVLCDPDSGKCYWVEIGPDADISVKEGGGWRVVVPSGQEFAPAWQLELEQVAENLSLAHRRLARLATDMPLVDALAEGAELRLSVEEWMNKSSGRGSFAILMDDGEQDVTLEKWEMLAPGWDYERLFEELFPWADLSVDDMYYEDYDEAAFNLSYAVYDKEDDRYYPFEDYSEWHRSLPELRPYADDGEIAYYRLVLTLNALGKGYREVHRFITSEASPRRESGV